MTQITMFTIDTKQCRTCKSVLPLNENYFYPREDSKDGFRNDCRDCKREEVRTNNFKHCGYEWGDYHRMLEDQQHRCANPGCRVHVSEWKAERQAKNNDRRPTDLCIDHCHTTNKIRGLLCSNCNTALGLLNESPEKMNGLLDYLDKASEL